MSRIKVSGLSPIASMRGEDDSETSEFQRLHRKAEDFLGSFEWCGGIKMARFGLGVSNIVAVFLFEIRPRRPGVDDLLWVVMGDIPPAYLVAHDAPDPAAALKAYIQEMRRWIDAVRSGSAVTDLIRWTHRRHRQMRRTSRSGSTLWSAMSWIGIATNRERVSSMKIWRLVDPNDDRYARASRRGTWSLGKGVCRECTASSSTASSPRSSAARSERSTVAPARCRAATTRPTATTPGSST